MTRLGFAGLGALGEALIREVSGVRGLEVVAAQDVRLDLARDIAARYAVSWYGECFEELLAADGVEAVVICTPNAFHASQAQAALRAGKDVLVQKPLALTHSDARGTVDVARQTERLLVVDYSYRFLKTMQAFSASLRALTGVRSVRAAFHNIYGPGAEKTWFFNPALSGGGALIDLGVHLLDLSLWLLRPHSVRLEKVSLSGAGSVENAASLLLMLDDVPFSLDVSWDAPLAATEISFEARTKKDLLRWENVDGSFFHFRTSRNQEVIANNQTTLREDTLRAFASALESRRSPRLDTRVYALLDSAYGRTGSSG